MSGNTVTLEFAGDADKLAKASKKAEGSITGVGTSATKASEDMAKSSKSSSDLLDKYSKLGNAVSGAGDAIDSASGLLDDFNQIQNASYEKSQAQQRALQDVQQAQEDYNQALRDGKQAAIDSDQAQVDLKQANLDASKALKTYNEAVKEHGKGSDEAKQAAIDLQQANVDVKQATEDSAQATRDGAQATIDAKNAQLDLSDAQRDAHPPDVAKWSQDIQTFAPLLSGLVGATGLVTAAQWAWNAAQAASPTTWIILAIVALVAVIVIIATKTTWFQTAWKAAWSGIKAAAGAVGSWFKDTLWGKWIRPAWEAIQKGGEAVWNWMKALPGKFKSAFAQIGKFISAPYIAAFNLISDAWNATIGRLSWTVPDWIPKYGGNTISAPRLPHFHQGGRVPGAPGDEVMAVLQAGETVSTRTSTVGGSGGDGWVAIRGDAVVDALVEAIAARVDRKGGRAAQLGIRFA